MESSFPQFHKIFSPCRTREPYDPSRHKAAAGRVPPALAIEWQNFGFGAYGGGIIWTVVPDNPFLDARDWPFLDGTGIEVLRTAFADVCLWQSGRFVWLNVLTGKVASFTSRADVIFESSLIEVSFRKHVLLEPLFEKATALLGTLVNDECFGFAPLPALGGAIRKEYLIKTSMREYVALAGHVLR